MSIPSWAVKGAKVVCIKGALHSNRSVNGWAPQTGCVYTVAGAFDCPYAGKPLLELVEYVHPMPGYGWDVARFRPAVTQEQDVAIFAPLLKTDHRAPERERA